MQTLTLPTGPVLRYYSDLDEFPAERRSYFTRYQIESAEIDLTPTAVRDRMLAIMQYNAEGKADEVMTSLQNMVFSLNAIAMAYAPDELSFGVLIHDIDGKVVSDFSPDGLRAVLTPLQVPLHTVKQVVDEVKKNSEQTDSATSLGLLGIYS